MPRSRNIVAAKARKKKVLKQAKGYLVEEKTYGLLLKMQLKKHYNIHIYIEKRRKEK